MSDCSGCQPITGTTHHQRIRAPHLLAALAFVLIALFLALPARADDPPPPPCPDADGDGYAVCTAACDSSGQQCGDPDDNDARIHPGSPCGLCNGNCGSMPGAFCVPGSTDLPCPDPTFGGNHNAGNSFCMNVNAPVIGVCSNNSHLNCFSSADCGGNACTPAGRCTVSHAICFNNGDCNPSGGSCAFGGTGSGLVVPNPDGSGAT